MRTASMLRNGDPGRNRTDNIQLRRLALYPIELRGRKPNSNKTGGGSRKFDDLASKQRVGSLNLPGARHFPSGPARTHGLHNVRLHG
jgi:hypothetical protein